MVSNNIISTEKKLTNFEIKKNCKNLLFIDKNSLASIKKNIIVNDNESLVVNFCDISDESSLIEINITLGENSSFVMKGCSLLKEGNKKYTINIFHEGKGSYSLCELFGINNSLSDKSSIKFELISTVKTDATKSNTRVVGKILNLNENVNSEILPILKINENDVKASHGAAVGSCNRDELYYLQSRGLNIEESKKLIIKGYFDDVIKSFNSEELKEKIDRELQ